MLGCFLASLCMLPVNSCLAISYNTLQTPCCLNNVYMGLKVVFMNISTTSQRNDGWTDSTHYKLSLLCQVDIANVGVDLVLTRIVLILLRLHLSPNTV